MKVLLTGGGGFIGRRLIAELLNGGHAVRTLDRRLTQKFPPGVESVVADLAGDGDLVPALDGVDVVVHLAASMHGKNNEVIRNTVEGTRHLLTAMANSSTRRLVLASSFVIYDRSRISGGATLNEDSPIHDSESMTCCDAYAQSKILQEILTRRVALQHGWALIVLRPSVVWGRDNWGAFLIGKRFGPVQTVVAPSSLARIAYVDNVADTFVRAVERIATSAPCEHIVNVIDDPVTSIRQFAKAIKPYIGGAAFVPVPYRFALLPAKLASILTCGSAKLPHFLQTAKVQAMHKPVTWSNRKLHDTLGWTPRYSFDEAIAREIAMRPISRGER